MRHNKGVFNLLSNTTELVHAFCEAHLARTLGIQGTAAGTDLREEARESEEGWSDGYLREKRLPGGLVGFDGTCGNGGDTLWLAGFCSKVFAVDIQAEAVRAADSLLNVAGLREKTELRQVSHSSEAAFAGVAEVHAAVFNLGYLPGGDKALTTDGATTVRALERVLSVLAVGGILAVTVYSGHAAGKEEREQVLAWARGLDKSAYHVMRTDFLNQDKCPPEAIFVTRKK